MHEKLIIKNFNDNKIQLKNVKGNDTVVWCGDIETAKAVIEYEKNNFQRIIVDFDKAITSSVKKRNRGDPKIAFIPSNDTHVKMFKDLTKYFDEYIFFYVSENGEGAKEFCKKYSLKRSEYSEKFLVKYNPDLVVLANDWGTIEQEAITVCNRVKIPTVCLQEGPLDFSDRTANRMKHAAFAFVQGPIVMKYLHRSMYFIVGNPRFKKVSNISGRSKELKVLINLNFTYGIFEDYRDSWLKDVINACRKSGLPYFISQHPRDNGVYKDIQVVKSDASKINSQIEQSSIIISRFSTLVYEAVFQGKYVIYYNPHNEKMELFNEDTTGGILKANSFKDLTQALSRLKNYGIDKKNIDEFKLKHCSYVGDESARKTAYALRLVPQLYKYLKERNSENS